MPNLNTTVTLLQAALRYWEAGYAVIPIYGEGQPECAKVAAVEWGPYQVRKPTLNEIWRWFGAGSFAGIAIVTGAISRLAVMDFDELVLFEQFAQQHPGLADTHTVRTQRGVHLYFAIPDGLVVSSRKTAGVDLQGEGRYVVAPPTRINGHQYTVVHDIPPRVLSNAENRLLLAFLDEMAATPGQGAAPESSALTRVSDGIQQDVKRSQTPPTLTAAGLETLYRYYAVRLGRNQALFDLAVQTRDDGWSQEQVVACLAATHAAQPSSSRHRQETYEQRYREAVRTIGSAFSRPARPRQDRPAGQLPNSAREALLALGQTHTLRVVEGLYLRGMQPGQVFTYAQAKQLLVGLVGDWSIRRALVAANSNGIPIFAVEKPSPIPPSLAYAATNSAEQQSNKCFLLTGSEPTRRFEHRPPRLYILPTPADLCRMLGVKGSGSDTLAEEDLASARGYRQALHREFIKRRPGVYARSWLAARLGVSVRTEQRYNVDIPINVQPLYQETPITWRTVNRIPAGLEIKGAFLEDERGKRYPPHQEIAIKLLSQRLKVTYKRRDLNYYWFGDDSPPLPVVMGQHPDWEALEDRLWQVGQYVAQHADLSLQHYQDYLREQAQARPPANPQPLGNLPLPFEADPVPPHEAAAPTRPARSKHVRQRELHRRYQNPLADSRLEWLANRVYDAVNTRAKDETDRISRVSARRLVDEYGAPLVEEALRVMARRREIARPAGWLTVFVRSTAKGRANGWIT